MRAYRNKNLLRLAKGKPCSRCGRQDGTVVAAHYSGRMSSLLAKGEATKAHDFATAHLCHWCHKYFDQHEYEDQWEAAADFMFCILKTWETILQTGEAKIVIGDKM